MKVKILVRVAFGWFMLRNFKIISVMEQICREDVCSNIPRFTKPRGPGKEKLFLIFFTTAPATIPGHLLGLGRAKTKPEIKNGGPGPAWPDYWA
jgi:hypothetical protein